MVDDTTLKSDIDIIQYTPPKSSAISDIKIPCLTLKIMNSAPLKPYNFLALSNERLERVQKQT